MNCKHPRKKSYKTHGKKSKGRLYCVDCGKSLIRTKKAKKKKDL